MSLMHFRELTYAYLKRATAFLLGNSVVNLFRLSVLQSDFFLKKFSYYFSP